MAHPELFHGTTTAALTQVLPAAETGVAPVHGATDPLYAYATTSEDNAWVWATKAAAAGAGDGVPRVYRVWPRGELEHDGTWNDNGRRCRRGFGVLDEVPRPVTL